MESSCLRHTELPHTSSLFADFLYNFERVAPFYEFAHHEASSYQAAAGRILFPNERREALVSALREQNERSPELELLARPGTAVVVTGQQIGLFSGPAYTIYKALTAVRLARQLSEQGIPAVPVFWLATEDHDFAEVGHCWVFDRAFRPTRLEARTRGETRGPVGLITISESPVAELRRSLGDFPYGEEVAALVEEAYVPGRTYGSAFGKLMKSLLSGWGMLYLDPMQPAVRKLAAPLLQQAVQAAPELTPLILGRNRDLENAGYHAQVHVEPHTSFLFLVDGDRRLPLRRSNGEYVSGERRFSAEELSERAEMLSPNALLRPVVQDYLLPTLAYVGGPAELAYLAQSQVLYRALLGRMPVVLHRASFTVLDSRSEKLFRRYGLSLPDFFHGEEAVLERIARKLIPPVLEREIRDATGQTAGQLERLTAQLAGFDPTLAASLEKSRRKILYQYSKIERKVARESLRRSERSAGDASYLCHLVYPEKHLQERLYSILPFLARHGFALLEHIYDNVRLDCPDHQVLVA